MVPNINNRVLTISLHLVSVHLYKFDLRYIEETKDLRYDISVCNIKLENSQRGYNYKSFRILSFTCNYLYGLLYF